MLNPLFSECMLPIKRYINRNYQKSNKRISGKFSATFTWPEDQDEWKVFSNIGG